MSTPPQVGGIWGQHRLLEGKKTQKTGPQGRGAFDLYIIQRVRKKHGETLTRLG